MARIPDAEIERLKLQVSLVRLVEAAGVTLKGHGKDWIGRCPFHDDKTPSLVISPKQNLWHCLGACQAGGSVVDWVMRLEGVSFRRAMELLRRDVGAAPVVPIIADREPGKAAPRVELAREAESCADDQALLCRIVDFYHATLKQSSEALAYLASRGLEHPELIDTFRLGFANRTLGYQLPGKETKTGAAPRTGADRHLPRLGPRALQRLAGDPGRHARWCDHGSVWPQDRHALARGHAAALVSARSASWGVQRSRNDRPGRSDLVRGAD